MRRRYKRRYQEGSEVPGVVSMNPVPMDNFINRRKKFKDSNLENTNLEQQAILNNQKQIIQQLQLNNQQLKQHNDLLNTQIELENKINEARKVKKTSDPGPKASPKRKGGRLMSMQEEFDKKNNKWIIASSNSSMRRGGTVRKKRR
tara:strand:+ start:1168 stop:1605 length:438 start_codon:yes stop_codon:yes gene_type:complete